MRLLFKILFSLTLLATAGLAGAWWYSPTFQERVLILGLISGYADVQKQAARELGDYPSKSAAAALLLFVNSYGVEFIPAEMVELKKQGAELTLKLDSEELPAEEAQLLQAELKRMKARYDLLKKMNKANNAARRKLANAGLWSLARMSGQSFGTDFDRSRSHSWRTVNKSEWPDVLWEMNTWAAEAFGADVLAAVGGLESADPGAAGE